MSPEPMQESSDLNVSVVVDQDPDSEDEELESPIEDIDYTYRQMVHDNDPSNLNMPNFNNEDEEGGMAGYMPLSQVPMEGDALDDADDDEEFEWTSAANETYQNDRVGSPVPPETIEVWSSNCTTSNIDLDADKIKEVKSVMGSFTLPSTAIPEWANAISEDQWKEQLIHRIKEIQKDKK